MRLFTASVLTNSEIAAGIHILEIYAPQLAQTIKPGQYCMLRCCDSTASDPLLRRPFFVHAVEPEKDLVRFLVFARGRGSRWVTRQRVGGNLDLLGPLGHAWEVRPQVRDLLLIGEAPILSSVISLAHYALEQEMAVTLVEYSNGGGWSYPVALLPPEIEYQVFSGTPIQFSEQLREYITWADALCCSVAPETLRALVSADNRWREKHFAQAVLWKPLICGSGACLTCSIETRQGLKSICRDGTIFAISELTDL